MPIVKRMASEEYVSNTVEQTVVLKINENAIPLPETATVGQFITVSAVDENGIVTPTDIARTVIPDNGYYGLSSVTVEAIPVS